MQESYHTGEETTRRPSLILVAVLSALAIVTFALWGTLRGAGTTATVAEAPLQDAKVVVRDVQPDDHVYGNPEAPIMFVVYADFECPYCKSYHTSLKLLVDMYGKEGQVAFVQRHMPIVKLHPHSPTHALAGECVAKEKGPAAFWNFADSLFATITPDVKIESAQLITLAEGAGVNRDSFSACMRSGELMAKVEKDFNEALDAGATETPFTMIITPYQQIAQSGAMPFPLMGATVTTMLRNLGDTEYEYDPNVQMPNLFEETPGATGSQEETQATSIDASASDTQEWMSDESADAFTP